MVDTKPLDVVTKKWEGAIGRVPAAYSEGVSNAKDVIAKGVAAEDLYAEKMAEAIADKRRARKLSEVSDEQWRAAAREKGAARIGPGMTAAKAKFRTGISDVLSTIQGVTLPARTADPSANIDNRVKPIALALHAMKKR